MENELGNKLRIIILIGLFIVISVVFYLQVFPRSSKEEYVREIQCTVEGKYVKDNEHLVGLSNKEIGNIIIDDQNLYVLCKEGDVVDVNVYITGNGIYEYRWKDKLNNNEEQTDLK